MLDRIEEYGKIKNMTNLDLIHDLYSQLVANVLQIDSIVENIEKLESESADVDQLERLYENEFLLYMNNVAIHEDLMKALDKEERTSENEFELARIKKVSENLLRVEVVEI